MTKDAYTFKNRSSRTIKIRTNTGNQITLEAGDRVVMLNNIYITHLKRETDKSFQIVEKACLKRQLSESH